MATAAGGRFRWMGERIFYGGYGLFVLLVVAAGFGPSRVARANASGPMGLTPLIWVHGFVFLAWVVLFITQASLISARQHLWHRRLGYTSLALVAAMLVLGVKVAATQQARGTVPPFVPDAETWLAVPLFDLAALAVLIAAGVANHHRAQYHKRFMLIATLVFLYAAAGRFTFLPLDFFAGEWTTILAALLMLPLIGWDLRQRGRIHPATAIGLGVVFGEQLLRMLLWHTPAWHSVARGIIGTLG